MGGGQGGAQEGEKHRQYTCRPPNDLTHHDICCHFDDATVQPLECGGHISEYCRGGIIGCGLHRKVKEGQAEGEIDMTPGEAHWAGPDEHSFSPLPPAATSTDIVM